jgi:basic membrane protein A
VPGTKLIVQYSNDFGAADKCQAVAQNEIGQGAKVLFQVAGGCGLGTLKAADDAGIWGIGVDSDEYNDAKRVLTSGTKKTDVGVYDTVIAAAGGKFQGGTDLVFNLKNHGVGVGRINPVVPAAWIKEMNQYRAKIVAGTFKVPTAIK